MDEASLWRHIADHRRGLGNALADLDDAEWSAPSVCPGWTVKDVAAHVIAGPQYTWASFVPLIVRGRFDVNRAILVDGQRRGRVSPAEVLRQFDEHADTRRTPPTTTPYEALIDVLVHSQDALRPLGRTLDLPPDAAAVAADRALGHAKMFGNPLGAVRVVATDVEWSHGTGPTVAAPMQEILLLVTGRAADARLVTGDGAAAVRTA